MPRRLEKETRQVMELCIQKFESRSDRPHPRDMTIQQVVRKNFEERDERRIAMTMQVFAEPKPPDADANLLEETVDEINTLIMLLVNRGVIPHGD